MILHLFTMRLSFKLSLFALLMAGLFACGKKDTPAPAPPPPPPPAPSNFTITSWTVDNRALQSIYYDVKRAPAIRLNFPVALNKSTASSGISLASVPGSAVSFSTSFINGDSSVLVTPDAPLNALTKYKVSVNTQLKSAAGGSLSTASDFVMVTSIDSSDKFTVISDTALVELVQKQTFRYFWDFAHPVSGLARERNTSGDVVTSGGSGFGIMAILTGAHRNFITRAQALTRLQTMVSFLKNTAQQFHGAYPHWLNGATGAVVPFSAKDNGADLVETSYLMQGLLCARQYFNGTDAAEAGLRADINTIWQRVEWNWFRRGGENVLYWHWSPDYNWDMNMPIKGWNECLITYVLAASSPGFSIPKTVYDNGWASNGGMKNGNSYYGYTLPLGPPQGGPLFFSHYSFLGINPNSLTDAYANYQQQVVNHTRINYEYCKANPRNFFGYSDQCWGLTASDIPNGYTASSPTNDVSVIAPTAALSSFAYTPAESMKALRFFYYKLGDKLWGEYGFKDAFSLQEVWFADSYLAIDQGPIVVMIENYRSGLLWNLFMSCPEVKTGMTTLGFTSPNL
ncbi:MAG TPA: glucoamylase family protein [Flavisolibacter sp.]|jgi:hypothetical protein|nr:glucoamylase family protein [Flavisolibacter sp.]